MPLTFFIELKTRIAHFFRRMSFNSSILLKEETDEHPALPSPAPTTGFLCTQTYSLYSNSSMKNVGPRFNERLFPKFKAVQVCNSMPLKLFWKLLSRLSIWLWPASRTCRSTQNSLSLWQSSIYFLSWEDPASIFTPQGHNSEYWRLRRSISAAEWLLKIKLCASADFPETAAFFKNRWAGCCYGEVSGLQPMSFRWAQVSFRCCKQDDSGAGSYLD